MVPPPVTETFNAFVQVVFHLLSAFYVVLGFGPLQQRIEFFKRMARSRRLQQTSRLHADFIRVGKALAETAFFPQGKRVSGLTLLEGVNFSLPPVHEAIG